MLYITRNSEFKLPVSLIKVLYFVLHFTPLPFHREEAKTLIHSHLSHSLLPLFLAMSVQQCSLKFSEIWEVLSHARQPGGGCRFSICSQWAEPSTQTLHTWQIIGDSSPCFLSARNLKVEVSKTSVAIGSWVLFRGPCVESWYPCWVCDVVGWGQHEVSRLISLHTVYHRSWLPGPISHETFKAEPKKLFFQPTLTTVTLIILCRLCGRLLFGLD